MLLAVARDPRSRRAVVEGWGLHSGEPARVVLSAAAAGSPVRFRGSGPARVQATIDQLTVASSHRATTVERATPAGTLRIATVEHLLAALAGLGVYEGVSIDVEGPELPLLDGGAAAWTEAIDSLAPARSAPRIRVTRRDAIDVGASRYEFLPGPTPVVQAVLQIDDPRLACTAAWRGDPADFRTRIASARTFALARDTQELLASGLARRVDPASVVLVAPDAIHAAGAPFAPDEPARHKVLDLMGDLYLAGGPPLGTIRAVRPGHSANARACRMALDAGVLART